MTDGTIIAVLTVESTQANAFDDEDRMTFESLRATFCRVHQFAPLWRNQIFQQTPSAKPLTNALSRCAKLKTHSGATENVAKENRQLKSSFPTKWVQKAHYRRIPSHQSIITMVDKIARQVLRFLFKGNQAQEKSSLPADFTLSPSVQTSHM